MEVEDREFEILLEEKRHKDIIVALKDIANTFKQHNNHEAVDKVEKQMTIIESLCNNIGKLCLENNQKDVNINNKIVDLLTRQLTVMIAEFKDIKNNISSSQNNSWEFKVKRNINGYIDSISATQNN